jgi:hypothetical protein
MWCQSSNNAMKSKPNRAAASLVTDAVPLVVQVTNTLSEYRCYNTYVCLLDLLLEDVLAQVRPREHCDDPRGSRSPEREGTGPTGRAHVFALSGAGCDPLRRRQQRRASLVQQGWLDFQGSQR